MSRMYSEKLVLEVIAAKHHWEVVSPPALTGRSGVTHRFDFVANNGQEKLVFDIFEGLSENDVIKTFIKKYDTGTSAYIICLGDMMERGAVELAREYGMKILRSGSVESDFTTKEIQPVSYPSN